MKNTHTVVKTFTALKFCALTLFFSCISLVTFGQEDIPNAPNPPRLYNNLSKEFPNLLSAPEAEAIEKELAQFAEKTSNQIVVLIVDDLAGYEPWDYATRIGDKWKVGNEKEDNGIVLLIKPTGGKGEREVFIATGRGLEGAIPDYTCNEIVENELLPNFKNQDFYAGIKSALAVLESLSIGEYNSDQYAKKNKKKDGIVSVIIVLIIIVFIVISISKGKGGGNAFTIGAAGAFFGSGMGGHRGGGHSGGGFGGFGGGSFGGGGSGGSW